MLQTFRTTRCGYSADFSVHSFWVWFGPVQLVVQQMQNIIRPSVLSTLEAPGAWFATRKQKRARTPHTTVRPNTSPCSSRSSLLSFGLVWRSEDRWKWTFFYSFLFFIFFLTRDSVQCTLVAHWWFVALAAISVRATYFRTYLLLSYLCCRTILLK